MKRISTEFNQRVAQLIGQGHTELKAVGIAESEVD